MPHHFCIFNFTWFTNLNILDLNKYAEHQLKVQIEVFCSNQFFSRRALFSCSQQFLQQTQALLVLTEQSCADPGFLQGVPYSNNIQKMNLPRGENERCAVSGHWCHLALWPSSGWWRGQGLNPRLGEDFPFVCCKYSWSFRKHFLWPEPARGLCVT